MKKSYLFVLVLLLALSACSNTAPAIPTVTATQVPPVTPTATAVPTPASPFDYDASIPFDVKVVAETQQEGATVVDLSYAAHDPGFSTPTGGRTLAYLVKPAQGEGPFAGVIYVHWLGQSNSTRKQYLDEAIAMAKHGVVSLLPQGYFPWMAYPSGDERDRPLVTGQLIELRRAVDFLLSQPNVDPQRLGYVGHDYGANYGGILAGVDHRLKTFVLIAGVPDFIQYIGLLFSPMKNMEGSDFFDPDKYVAQAAPASIFFQFGTKDKYIPQEMGTQFYEAASEPKKIGWYDDLHYMTADAIRQEREAWLVQELGLEP